MSTLMLLAGIAAAAATIFFVRRKIDVNRIGALNERRRAESWIVGSGVLVDGNRHLGVALALTRSTLFYENQDIDASVDMSSVEEIEYDSCLATGHSVNGSVLRLRSHSQSLEFVIPPDTAARWVELLPPRSMHAQRETI